MIFKIILSFILTMLISGCNIKTVPPVLNQYKPKIEPTIVETSTIEKPQEKPPRTKTEKSMWQ